MTQSNKDLPKEYIRLGILIHTAIAGASIAAVIQLASRESLAPVQLLSIFCFAIAIPASVAMIFISQLLYPEGMRSTFAMRMELQKWPLLSYFMAFAEQISFFGGFLALFWSFRPVAGILFLGASLLALITVSQVEKRLKNEPSPPSE
jgi:hypothetical protein